jgi:serine/threonine-protein kinase
MALGTPSYMAPEQMREGTVDERVDIYGTGLVLYEMLTAHKPFEAPSTGEILLKQQRQPPPFFRKVAPHLDIPPAVEAVVRRALEKAPEARYPSALAMRDALEACAAAAAAAPAPGPGASGPRDATVFEPMPWGASAPRGSPASAPLLNTLAPLRALERLRQQARAGLLATYQRARTALPGAAAHGRWKVLVGLGTALVTALLLWLAARPHPTPLVGPPLPPELTAALPAAKPAPPPAAAPAAATASGPDDVRDLLAAGKTDEALARLRELRKAEPNNADYAIAQARLCFSRHRYREGLAAFRAAIHADPARKSDTQTIDLVVASLENDRFAPDAETFLRELGAPARAQVKEAAKNHPNPRVRERARDLVRDWNQKPWFRGWRK